MKNVAENLREILKEILPLLENITENEAGKRPLPGKWSKKEILGHLIDSACNNQQKFVRTMAGEHLDFVGYKQNHWVDSQKYNKKNWKELIVFWQTYNLHISHIIENVETEVLTNTITIEEAGPFTLEFIMKDYLEHLKHHLKQILPEASLENDFENVYNA